MSYFVVWSPLVVVLVSGCVAYGVHRENLRDARLKQRRDEIRETLLAAYNCVDVTVNAVSMVQQNEISQAVASRDVRREGNRFLALYNLLHIDNEIADRVTGPSGRCISRASQEDFRDWHELNEATKEMYEGLRDILDQLKELANSIERERSRSVFGRAVEWVKTRRSEEEEMREPKHASTTGVDDD